MEIDGHPTQDLIEELERRGAVRVIGSTTGPHSDAVHFVRERLGDQDGSWLFLPDATFDTGFDELPSR